MLWDFGMNRVDQIAIGIFQSKRKISEKVCIKCSAWKINQSANIIQFYSFMFTNVIGLEFHALLYTTSPIIAR
jgi:hypothetical protein